MGVAAIIAAVLALAGVVTSSVVNYNSQQETNELQRKLANQANQWQIQQRDYENWFNSPAGLQSRGLNPSLAMSAAGAGLAQSASAGSANLPSDLKAPQVGDLGSSLSGAFDTAMQGQLTQAQVDNIQSVTDLNNAEAALKEKELPIKQQQYLNMKQEYQNLLKENQRISSEIRKLDASAQKDIAEAVNIPKMFDLKSKEVDATIDSLKADARYKNILGNLTNREIWERGMTWTLRLNGLDLANQETASRVGLNNSMTNTEWFKQQDYNSQIMYRGTLNAQAYTEFYLEALGVPEAEIKSNYSKADYDVMMSSGFTRFVSYLNHAFGKAVSPVLSRFNLGVNYSFGSKTINSTSYRSPTRLK